MPNPNAALSSLREHVRAAAKNLPGTYRMVAETGEILYVGKSKQLRARLLSYFRAGETEKAARILRDARELEWSYEPSEFAALLREMRLIKRFRPRYNVRHKRDGLFSFLKLIGGAAPKLTVVRRVSDDTGTYFGPFRGGKRISEAVRELNDVLGLRDCSLAIPIHYSDQREIFAADRTPRCHRFEVRRCLGPCAGLCDETTYRQRVRLAVAFLDGNAEEPIEWLTRDMAEAARNWQFERAALLRDRIARLEGLREEFTRLREALDGLSFVYRVAGVDGDDRVYVVRRGTVRAEAAVPRSAAQRRALARLVDEHFNSPEGSSLVVSKHQVDEILLLAQWFRGHPDEWRHTTPPRGHRRTRREAIEQIANGPA